MSGSDKKTTFVAIDETSQVWRALIHKTMYLVARTFDFQTFNQAAGSANGQTTWVPATAGVAADHLCQLLVTDGMPREILKDEPTVDWQRGIGSMQIPFAKAAWRLHATIFQPYEQWAEHVRVPAFPKAEKNTRASQMVEFLVIRVALLDLCLYFAIWTEAANVKHMPEGMWYIYWVLRHSRDFQDLVTNCSVRSDDAWILNPWIRNSPGEASFIVQLAERRTFLRNQFASLINEVRTNAVRERRQDKLSQYIRTDTMRHQDRNRDMLHCVLIENRPSPGDTDDSSGVVLGMIAEYLRAKGQMVDPVDVQILLDLLVYGDGGEFSRRIITPIFQFLAFEIDKKGGSGKEPVLRITYDDANESFVHTDNFSSVRSKLGVKNTDESYKAFTTLWELGGSREWNEKTAREWYRANVFKKTYQERRTWFAPFRANFRVIAFHILLFHVMLVLALLQETDTWENAGTALTSVIITHTFLEMVEAYGGAYISLSVPTPPAADKDAPYVSRNAWVARICCLLPCIGRYKRTPTEYESLRDSKIDNKTEWGTAKLGGAVSWIKTFGAFLVWFALWLLATAIYVLLLAAPNSIKSPVADTTLPEDERETLKHWLRGIWDYIGPIYPIVMGIHWLVTMRDGYITGAHTVSSGAAGCWTSFLKLCCGGFNNMFSNAITSSESFMFTNPSVGWLQFFINALFWFFVLAGKIAFDYFLVVKNLASPIKNLLKIGYLSSGDGDFPNSNIPYPDADFILVAALCLPALLIVIVDTGVFYQVGVFIYGCGNGLLRLRLGLITDWSDVIKEFTSAVENFHDKVLSADGKKAWMDQRHINNYYNKHLQGDHDTNLTVGLQPGQDRDAKMDPKDVLYLARWTTFADCWDQIISEMRENDLVSNAEADNLRFKKLTILKKYGMRPLVFPGIFYAGKIQAIMDRASIPMRGNVTVLLEIYSLFLVMLKEVNIISAQNVKVSELFQVTLLASTTNTYHIKIRDSLVSSIRSIINNISTLVSEGKALRKNEAYVRGADSDPVRVEAHKARDKMIEAIAKDTKNITDFAEIEIELLKAQTRKDYASKIAAVKNLRKSVLSEDRNIRASPAMMRGLAELHGGHMPQVERIVDMLKNAMNQTEQQAQPKNPEACRLLRFFMASLFNPQLKSPASLEHVMSLTTLVPHYAEDVIYALDANAVEQAVGVRPKAGEMTDLVAPTGYDISTIEYLKVVNGIEWDNFIERVLEKYYQEPGAEKYEPQEVKDINVDDFRMKIKQVGVSDGQPKWIHGRLHAYANDLMLWASQRGQLLARTTRGMLLYEKALRVMATLEIAHSTDEAELQTLLEAKFRHIVASQVYGEKKASKKAGDRWLANAVDTLMQKYPSFRVAYIDSKKLPTGEKLQYSVLLRNVHDDKTGTNTVQEVYRVRLPMQSETQRGVVLGEGKPENQNHAAIFCFGEAIQTVDMNQDNCLAEALKMRNLLREFGTDGPQNVPLAEASRRGTKGDYFTVNVADFRRRVSKEVVKRTTALVGFREYIFSNTAGSVGAFAAGAEFAFGTIVQRTMANPGGVRFHYGHPDVWNKLFTMTRGGVSKATRAFHISEDVFGGYNTVQRGARIKYREYISVGKGRDVGFEQINGFEAKVAGGNGEQAISRDVYRLGTRLDWFRLMSWYHSGIGFFMNTALLMSSIYIAVWVLFVFALVTNGTLKIEEADQTGNAIRTRSVDDTIPVFNSIQVVQIGFMSILPYFGELCLEEGLIPGIFSIARQMIAGSILFFIFRQQTSAHFFTQDVYYGGAAYVATGRGFALTHTPFVTMFSNFGRSHMYFGFQLGLMAFVLAFLDINSYALSTWGTWLVSISLFFGPFWFNPLSFTTGEVYKDYLGWKAWMKDNRDPKTGKSWYTWHTGQLAKARNTAGLQTDHWWNRFAGVMMQMFNIVIVMACFENIDDKYVVDDQTKKSKLVKKIGILAFEGIVMLIPLWLLLKNLYKEKVQKTLDRVLSVLFFGLFIAIFVLYIVYFGNTGFDGFKDIVLLSYANTTMFIILVQWLLYIFPNHKWAQDLVDAGYYAADVALGLVLFAVLFILSLIPIIDSLQATLLFNFEFVKESENSGLRRLLDKLSRPGQSDDKPSPSQAKKTS